MMIKFYRHYLIYKYDFVLACSFELHVYKQAIEKSFTF